MEKWNGVWVCNQCGFIWDEKDSVHPEKCDPECGGIFIPYERRRTHPYTAADMREAFEKGADWAIEWIENHDGYDPTPEALRRWPD